MVWGNTHYQWHKIQLRHIFHTAQLSGLSKIMVEEILHEICQALPSIYQIAYQHLPNQVSEPIITGLEAKINYLNSQ